MEQTVREREGQYYVEADGAVLSGGVYANRLSATQLHEDGQLRGTFRSYTMLLTGDQIRMEHVTVANEAGPGKQAGQAIALYADGDGLIADHCHFLGHQDTLFLAPLPPKEIQKNGFLGPGQFTPCLLYTSSFMASRITAAREALSSPFSKRYAFLPAEPGTVNPLSSKIVTIRSNPMEKPQAGVSIPVNLPIILS